MVGRAYALRHLAIIIAAVHRHDGCRRWHEHRLGTALRMSVTPPVTLYPYLAQAASISHTLALFHTVAFLNTHTCASQVPCASAATQCLFSPAWRVSFPATTLLHAPLFFSAHTTLSLRLHFIPGNIHYLILLPRSGCLGGNGTFLPSTLPTPLVHTPHTTPLPHRRALAVVAGAIARTHTPHVAAHYIVSALTCAVALCMRYGKSTPHHSGFSTREAALRRAHARCGTHAAAPLQYRRCVRAYLPLQHNGLRRARAGMPSCGVAVRGATAIWLAFSRVKNSTAWLYAASFGMTPLRTLRIRACLMAWRRR